MSDLTPSSRHSIIPRWHPVEALNIYGWFRTEAWDRYFLNEAVYDATNYTEGDFKRTMNPYKHCNLETESGRK
jgi:hypothetical protein